MSKAIQLDAEARTQGGKGAARAARREGKVPAVIYGNNKNPAAISVSAKDLVKVMSRGGFTSKLVELNVDGKAEQVIPRDVQFHPVNDRPMHADFLRVSKNAKVTVEVTVNFINEDVSPGLKAGGVLNVVRHTVEVNAPATAIPEFIEVDLSSYDVGDSIHFSAVTMDEGVTSTITDRDFTIATIAAPSALKSEAEEDAEAAEAAAEAAEAAEGEEGAAEGEGGND